MTLLINLITEYTLLSSDCNTV